MNDPFYEPLYGEPEFQRIVNFMKARLEAERSKLRAMEAAGDLAIPYLQ